MEPGKPQAAVDFDLSVLELRCGALEVDGRLTDIHRATAAELFGVPYAEVTAKQRREGKRRNFLKIYGG